MKSTNSRPGASASKGKGRGVFVAGRGHLDSSSPELLVFGYVKPEDSQWIAVCINLGLVAQGQSDEEALFKLFKSMESYVSFVQSNYPNKWRDVLDSIKCDQDLLDEFKRIARQLESIPECLPVAKSAKRAKPTHKPPSREMRGTVFATEISPAYAQ